MQPGPRGPGGRSSGLPYQILAGVEPVTGGWLVVPGNLQGINLAPQPAQVMSTLADVLDYRPSFSIVALHAPVGVMEKPGEVRSCDIEARGRLGRRAGSVVPAPSRALLEATTYEEAREIEPNLDIVRWRRLAKASEAIREVQSWRQRTVYEVNPELAFTIMNDGEPLPYSRRSQLGREARGRLVEAKLPGAAGVLAQRPPGIREEKLIDALADLWTARRIMAHAVVRSAEEPVWDEEGVRMDIVS
jgi:predicted RNase H-like nuclease